MGAGAEGGAQAYLLAQDDVVALHERILGREDGLDVAIELDAEQHGEHAEEVGKENEEEHR